MNLDDSSLTRLMVRSDLNVTALGPRGSALSLTFSVFFTLVVIRNKCILPVYLSTSTSQSNR